VLFIIYSLIQIIPQIIVIHLFTLMICFYYFLDSQVPNKGDVSQPGNRSQLELNIADREESLSHTQAISDLSDEGNSMTSSIHLCEDDDLQPHFHDFERDLNDENTNFRPAPTENPSEIANEDEGPFSLWKKLAKWAVDCKIPHRHLNSLLKILKPHRPELPLDAVTLLSGPPNRLSCDMTNGSCHLRWKEQADRMENKLDSIFSIVRSMQEKMNSRTDVDDVHIEDQFNFPMNSQEDLQLLETSLGVDPALQKNLCSFLITCGGNNAKEYVRRCLRRTFGDSLLSNYCGRGKSPLGKLDFSKLNFYCCMLRSMRQCDLLKHESEKVFQQGVGDFLRHTTDRLKRSGITLTTFQ